MILIGTLGAPGAHLGEDVFVRRLDGELDPGEAGRVEAHLAVCAECRAGFEEMAALSRRFSDALPLVDLPAPGTSPPVSYYSRVRPAQRRWGSPVWRAAAALAFVAGLALAISPVRAWIAERLGLGSDRPPAESVAPAERTVGPVEGGGDIRIAFVPTGDRFTIRVAGYQATGALVLAPVPGDTASGEIRGPGEADLLVLPDGLGIRNARTSTADYRVLVPQSLARIEVRVGDRVAWRGTPDALASGILAIDLTLQGRTSDGGSDDRSNP